MTAAVETMAYTNQVPWHGLGTHIADAPSVDKMIEVAGIDWEVEKRPMVAATTFDEDAGWSDYNRKVDRFYALTRTSDSRTLDVVGNHYTPVQNRAAFEFFKEFVEEGGATMETAGSLMGGRYVWGLANLNAGFKLGSSDQVNGYLLVAKPHQQGKAFVMKTTAVRVVCNNTLTMALQGAGAEFRMVHRSEFNEAMMERAQATLGSARDTISDFAKSARKLKALKMSHNDTIRNLQPVYQPQMPIEELLEDPDTNASARMKQLLDINQRAPGADPKTGWGVLNAVTYYADHIASRTADKRLTNAWMGKTARQKDTVLASLLEAA